MAEKRMFTQKVVESDDFLDMPFSARCLYFHLNMNADDDGFLNSSGKVIRIAGATNEDLRILIEKRFVLDFENGVIVIKHWRMHNTLKKDRYKPTQYQKLFSMLTIKEDGSYTERNHGGNGMEPERNHSIVENSLDKISKEEFSEVEERKTETTPPTLPQVIDYVRNNNLAVNPNRFFTYYNDKGWKTSNGNQIDWKAKIQEWDFADKQKAEAVAKNENKTSSNPFLELAKDENLF